MTVEDLTPVPQEARAYQGQRAGLVSRTIANTVDAVVVAVIVGSLYLGFNAARFFLGPTDFTLSEPAPLSSMTTVLVVLGAYLSVAWATTGRTYGCHVMGLRVVGRRGGRLRPVVSLARGVFCTLFPIGLLWCAVSSEKRSVQDVVLRTSVIYDWKPRAPKTPT
jgi:uncharacterized RDD family membrane protein YckC